MFLSLAARQKFVFAKKIVCCFMTLSFVMSLPGPAGTQMANLLPAQNAIAPVFMPPLLKGLNIHPENPFLFDFIVNPGDDKLQGAALKAESEKLVKFFLAAMTIPDKEAWVNLSPYEADRIIPEALGKTEMGKVMLEQDYLLKQMSSSLTNPETDLGKKFWAEVKAKVQQELGTTNVPMSTFNKVWIVPAKAEVAEKDGKVYVTGSSLKVMLEEDFVALEKTLDAGRLTLEKTTNDRARNVRGSAESTVTRPTAVALEKTTNVQPPASRIVALSSQIFRSTILPELEKKINQDKDFAPVRQIYDAAILAVWYKNALKDSLLGRIYADKSKVKGVETNVVGFKEDVYNQYLAAFKKGAYNVIKEDFDMNQNESIPRRYFSGGLTPVPTLKDLVVSNGIRTSDAEKNNGEVSVRAQLTQDGPEQNLVAERAAQVAASAVTGLEKILVQLRLNAPSDAQMYQATQNRYNGNTRALNNIALSLLQPDSQTGTASAENFSQAYQMALDQLSPADKLFLSFAERAKSLKDSGVAITTSLKRAKAIVEFEDYLRTSSFDLSEARITQILNAFNAGNTPEQALAALRIVLAGISQDIAVAAASSSLSDQEITQQAEAQLRESLGLPADAAQQDVVAEFMKKGPAQEVNMFQDSATEDIYDDLVARFRADIVKNMSGLEGDAISQEMAEILDAAQRVLDEGLDSSSGVTENAKDIQYLQNVVAGLKGLALTELGKKYANGSRNKYKIVKGALDGNSNLLAANDHPLSLEPEDVYRWLLDREILAQITKNDNNARKVFDLKVNDERTRILAEAGFSKPTLAQVNAQAETNVLRTYSPVIQRARKYFPKIIERMTQMPDNQSTVGNKLDKVIDQLVADIKAAEASSSGVKAEIVNDYEVKITNKMGGSFTVAMLGSRKVHSIFPIHVKGEDFFVTILSGEKDYRIAIMDQQGQKVDTVGKADEEMIAAVEMALKSIHHRHQQDKLVKHILSETPHYAIAKGDDNAMALSEKILKGWKRESSSSALVEVDLAANYPLVDNLGKIIEREKGQPANRTTSEFKNAIGPFITGQDNQLFENALRGISFSQTTEGRRLLYVQGRMATLAGRFNEQDLTAAEFLFSKNRDVIFTALQKYAIGLEQTRVIGVRKELSAFETLSQETGAVISEVGWTAIKPFLEGEDYGLLSGAINVLRNDSDRVRRQVGIGLADMLTEIYDGRLNRIEQEAKDFFFENRTEIYRAVAIVALSGNSLIVQSFDNWLVDYAQRKGENLEALKMELNQKGSTRNVILRVHWARTQSDKIAKRLEILKTDQTVIPEVLTAAQGIKNQTRVALAKARADFADVYQRSPVNNSINQNGVLATLQIDVFAFEGRVKELPVDEFSGVADIKSIQQKLNILLDQVTAENLTDEDDVRVQEIGDLIEQGYVLLNGIENTLADVQVLSSENEGNISPEPTVLTPVAASSASSQVGGINFDPSLMNLQVKRDKNGVPLPVFQQDLPSINIEGLYPVIINIAPATMANFPLLSKAEEAQQNKAALKAKLSPVDRQKAIREEDILAQKS